MKVIFLDFDGVLTTSKNYGVLDDEKMELLCDLIKATDSFVVISSSWRHFDLPSTIKYIIGDRTPDEVKDCLGFWLKRTIGVTPRPMTDEFIEYDDWTRENEIKKYLETSGDKIDNFIILDDMEDEFKDPKFKDRLVKTNYKTGLTKENVCQALKLLNEER